MTNISFLQSAGDAIFMNDIAYELVGQTLGVPTNSTGEITNSNIVGQVFTNADAQGNTEWTPGQVALAQYKFGLKGVSITIGGGGYHEILICPVAGVFRMWGPQMDAWYVNGIAQATQGGNFAASRPVNVAVNDIIAVHEFGTFSNIIYSYALLPFTYP